MLGGKGLSRPSRDEYYLAIAKQVAQRSTCLKNKVGAIVVVGDMIVATGYNGAPRGEPHCIDIGFCARANQPRGHGYEDCRGVHAETNALLMAAKHGISVNGGIMYVTAKPCNICRKLMKQAGISKVIYLDDEGKMQSYMIE
ncbi:cytidine deaminase [Candidatus Bathyarchaeota archaeon]|nr:MAG: cytidine deaminase [Candidatus Bathyarchaeota archaeon]